MSGARPQLRAAEEPGSEPALLAALHACATDPEAGLRQLRTAFGDRARTIVARQIRSPELVDRIVDEALGDLCDQACSTGVPPDPDAAANHAFATLRHHVKRAVATPSRRVTGLPHALARERRDEPHAPSQVTAPPWLAEPDEASVAASLGSAPIRSVRVRPPRRRRGRRALVLAALLVGLVAASSGASRRCASRARCRHPSPMRRRQPSPWRPSRFPTPWPRRNLCRPSRFPRRRLRSRLCPPPLRRARSR